MIYILLTIPLNQPVHPLVHISCKCNFSQTDELILMKLHSFSIWPKDVHEGRWSRSEKYQGRLYKGDNYLWLTSVCILCDLTHSFSFHWCACNVLAVYIECYACCVNHTVITVWFNRGFRTAASDVWKTNATTALPADVPGYTKYALPTNGLK